MHRGKSQGAATSTLPQSSHTMQIERHGMGSKPLQRHGYSYISKVAILESFIVNQQS